MEYNKLIDKLKKETYWSGRSGPESRDIHPVICDEAAAAITELLGRAEEAEARVEKAERELGEAIEAICQRCTEMPCAGKECRWYRGEE